MNAKVNPEDHYLAKLDEYFTHDTPKEYFSKSIRNYIHVTFMLFLESENLDSNVDEISSGYYQLTRLLEILDPVLEKEQ